MRLAKKVEFNKKGRSIHKMLCGICLTCLSSDGKCLNDDKHNKEYKSDRTFKRRNLGD